jgi:hypothetical protein
MGAFKDEIIRLIGNRAEKEAAYLAGEFARAASKDKEDLLAALEYEQWLAETCWLCLDQG